MYRQRGEGRLAGAVEPGRGRATRSADLTMNLPGAALSVAPRRSCREPIHYMWTCYSRANVRVCVCMRLQRGHALPVPFQACDHIFSVLLFSRCNAAGRLYKASKTGSYYQRPLTCVCTFLVHLRVYGPADKETKFILCPLSVTPQSHERLDSH